MNGPTYAAHAPARPAAAAKPAAAPKPAVKPDADPAVFVARLVCWVKLYWLTVLFLGGLLGCGLAYAAWALLPSKYESYALLRVASNSMSVSNQKDATRGRTEFNTYIKTNARLIRNEFVLAAALGKEIDGRRISDLPTLKDQKNPLQFLEEEIQVPTPADGVEIISVSMKGHNPADTQLIVNAVVQAFLDEVIEKEIKDRKFFLDKVEAELVKLQTKLADRVRKPLPPGQPALAGLPQLPGAAPVPGAVPESVRRMFVSALVTRVNALTEQTEQLPLAITSQRSRVESLQKQIAGLTQGPAAAETLAAAEADPAVQAARQREKAFRAKYNQGRASYENPNAEALRIYLEQADAAAAEAQQTKDKKIRELETARRQGKADPLFPQLDEATRKLRDLEDQLRAADAKLKKAREELAQLPPDPAKDIPAKPGEPEKKPLVDPDNTYILAEDDIFRNTAYHAATLRLDIESPKRVSVLQPASTPVQKDTKKQVIGTAFAGLLGFALVGLAVVGFEARAKRVCGLLDLKATTPVPVVGVIPYPPDWAAATDPLKRAEVTEAVDKLRSYVAQTYLARGATTVAVTSPLGDEGKAFAAFRLASSLAAGGYKTLLVDFDLRNPTLHALAGVENPAGVCELLRGESDLRRTVQVLPTGLHLLPAGNWSDDARQHAVGGKLEALVSRLKEPFDCVIVHAHALLTAAETVEVARRCEVVLLAALYRDTRLPLLKKAADRLATMEVPYTGLVYLGATPHEALC